MSSEEAGYVSPRAVTPSLGKGALDHGGSSTARCPDSAPVLSRGLG